MASLPAITVAEALGPIPGTIEAVLGPAALRRSLSAANLPQDFHAKVGDYVPEIAINRILESAARSAGDELFGLYLAEGLSVRDYGAWGDYVLEAPTLRSALFRASSIIGFHANADRLRLIEGRGTSYFQYVFAERKSVGYQHVALAGLGPLLSIPRHFRGSRWRPVSIGLDLGETKRQSSIEDRLGTATRCDAPCIYLEILNTDLAADNPNAATSWTTRADVVRQCNGGPPRQLVPYVEQLVVQRVGVARTAIDDIASLMSLSRRSLQRHLDAEGTTFKAITASAKMRRAAELLSDSRMQVSEIAALLDYSTPSHFARAFRKRYGRAPGEFRMKGADHQK